MIATLFDFDGVLVDSEPVHLAAFNDVLAPLALRIDPAAYVDKYMALDDAGVFAAVLADAGLEADPRRVGELVEAKAPRFLARFGESFRPFPGAVEIVARRARGGLVGIVSGARDAEIAFALERLGLGPAIAFVVSADRGAPSKPDPAPYRLAMEELRGRGHHGAAVVVEDSVGGVVSAIRAGLRCIAVAHSHPIDELLRAGAHAAVPDLASITDALLDGESTRAEGTAS